MKNLYKKLGAIALAGMVVAGGFAASGAQSFANSKKPYPYLIQKFQKEEELEKKREEAKEKVQKIIESFGNSDYEVVKSYFSKNIIQKDLIDNYSHLGIPYLRIPRVRRNSQLKSLLSFNYSVFMVEFDGMYHLIVKK